MARQPPAGRFPFPVQAEQLAVFLDWMINGPFDPNRRPQDPYLCGVVVVVQPGEQTHNVPQVFS